MDATAIFTIKHLPHKPFSLSSLSLSKDLLTSSSSSSSNVRHSQKLFKVASSSSGTRDSVVFDEAAYEAERLALDAEARESMFSGLEVFGAAKCVKVNPDTPQKQVRSLTLTAGKQLLTPQPRLRTGFFSILDSSMLTPSTIKEACTSVGVAKYGRSIRLDEKIKVDIIVIGSVAVDRKTSARLGKGEVSKVLKRIA
ncbi:hypothetical protein RJ639_045135 [Escallonia herrerae]|uniref:Uncharacterized protein n=1 Tax=Escallonia herrerae TaxID=1293975 RepID=A0AA88W775_9ASTE|nr:hypothetical protein RJ639_045135 [Escallonia herrerae]